MSIGIPSIQEIYNCYHRETFFAAKSFYPKAIKNFDKIITPDKKELLKRFQSFIKRNNDLIDWKIYVKACAQYFKRNFDLKILGSLNGNKIYRTYVSYKKLSDERTQDEIYDDILNSLKFLKDYVKLNEMTMAEYFKDRSTTIPISLKHIYSGAVSEYLYACFNESTVFKMFSDIPDDVFFELFNYSRNDFFEFGISVKRQKIICMSKIFNIINNISDKFASVLQ